MSTHYVESAQTMVIAPEESDSDPWSSSDDGDSSSENETERVGNSASSTADPDEYNGFPAAVNAAYKLHEQYHDDAFRAFEQIESSLNDGTLNQGICDGPNAPVLPIRGEYILYSPCYQNFHYQNNPTLWTEEFASTWMAGSIRFGQRWRNDWFPIGAECTIAGLRRPLTFGCPEARCFVGKIKDIHADGGNVSRDKDPKSWTICCLKGSYMLIYIPATEIGDTIGEEDYLFIGILDRTEEEMAATGFAKNYWSRPVPYYEAPYISTLPQGRTRYLAPTSLGEEEPCTPAAPKIQDETNPTTVCHTPRLPTHMPGHSKLQTQDSTMSSSWNDNSKYEKALADHQAHEANCLRFASVVEPWFLDDDEKPIESLEGNWTLYSPGLISMAHKLRMAGQTDLAYTVGTICLGKHELSDECWKHYPLKSQVYITGLGSFWWISPDIPHYAFGGEEEDAQFLLNVDTRIKITFFVTFLTGGVMKLRLCAPSESGLDDVIVWAVNDEGEVNIQVYVPG